MRTLFSRLLVLVVAVLAGLVLVLMPVGSGSAEDRVVLASVESADVWEVNVGVAPADPFRTLVSGEWVGFTATESEVGGDRNGDGDAFDRVVFGVDGTTTSWVNSGLAAFVGMSGGQFDLGGDLLAVTVSEPEQGGVDLNGDGDADDAVFHLFNLSTSTTVNMALAAYGPGDSSMAVVNDGGDLLAMRVYEPQQGATDLNGDADVADEVIYVHDVTAASTTNLGYAVDPSFSVTDDLVVFCVSEMANGSTDLNGDGDADDSVVHVYDRRTTATTNLGISGCGISSSGEVVRIPVSESNQGAVDLNGDGDTEDDVLHVYDARTDTTTNVGVALAGGERQPFTDSVVDALVSESNQGGIDLNGDGDATDEVLHVYDVATTSLSNTGLAGGYPVVTDDFVAFGVQELYQGDTDLNGDGDTDDVVLHVWDVSSKTSQNLGLNSWSSNCRAEGAYLLVLGREAGDHDFNADGDMDDSVLHVYDDDTGALTNIGLAAATESLAVSGQVGAFAVREADQATTDFNADGDADDEVIHLIDLEQWLVGNTTRAYADSQNRLAIGAGSVVGLVSETDDGGTDHNRDGQIGAHGAEAVLFLFGFVSDTTDPVVSLVTPPEGGLYQIGASILADYTCSDDESGIASCIGSVADGLRIDTATAGSHTFSVTATDNEANTTTVSHTYTVYQTDVFTDDDLSIFEPDIDWLAATGITKGCNPPINDRYCPDSVVTRGQMAAFLTRALGLTERLDDPFTDDDDSVFEADIEKLAAAGITKGCNPPDNDRFCPDGKVTREQMAAFLVRALKYTDDGGGDLFVDDDDSTFEADIDRLGTAGVTRGCNPPVNDRYCPKGNVTRGQMAAFLHRALG